MGRYRLDGRIIDDRRGFPLQSRHNQLELSGLSRMRINRRKSSSSPALEPVDASSGERPTSEVPEFSVRNSGCEAAAHIDFDTKVAELSESVGTAGVYSPRGHVDSSAHADWRVCHGFGRGYSSHSEPFNVTPGLNELLRSVGVTFEQERAQISAKSFASLKFYLLRSAVADARS
jgi:hypothetical protein